MNTLHISVAQHIVSHNTIRFELTGKRAGFDDIVIFWEHSGKIIPDNETSSDFAISAMLPYGMHHRCDLHIHGCVSEDFLESIEECQDIWSRWRPDLYTRINVHADEIVFRPVLKTCTKAIMAFSGGADACFSLLAHKTGLIGVRAKRIEAAVLILGFDIPLDLSEWAKIAVTSAEKLLEESGVSLTVVKTNWKEYCVNWEMAHGFGVTTVLQQFRNSFECAIWSADEAYGAEIIPWGNNSTPNAYLSGKSYPIISTGAGWNRTEKIKLLSKSDIVCQQIRVCWAFPEGKLNCGKCEKCVRTYLNFMIAGKDSVPAISNALSPATIARVKIKHKVAEEYYREIFESGRNVLPPVIKKAVRTVLRRAPFYIYVKKMLDKNKRIKRLILGKIDPRSHY